MRFAARDCAACASRDKCVRSPSGQSRTLILPERSQAEALEKARGDLSTAEGRAEYGLRAEVEGTLSQAVRRSGLRRARYRGLIKTHLQQVATAAGLKRRARSQSSEWGAAGTDTHLSVCRALQLEAG